MQSVILTGPILSGQSTVGRQLVEQSAARFRIAFADSDKSIVERVGKPIPRIFEEDN